MDIKKGLSKLKRDGLISLAVQLKLTEWQGLEKDALINLILSKRTEQEITGALDEIQLPVEYERKGWWKQHKKRILTVLAIIGTIASVMGLFKSSADVKIDADRVVIEIVKQNPTISPEELSRLWEKVTELEEALKNEALGNLKERKEALEALSIGDISNARVLFERLREKERQKEKLHAKTAYNLGNIYSLELKYEKALASYLEAGRLAPENTLYLNEIGVTCHILADDKKAIESFSKAPESDLKTYGEQHPNVATSWNNLGEAWKSLGEYKKAIEFFNKALQSGLKTYGDQHPQVAIYWNNLGTTWDSLGEYKKAIEFYNKALQSDLKTYGEHLPSVARDWNNLGSAWQSLGEYKKAIEFYNKALTVCENKLGPNHPNTKLVKENLIGAQQGEKERKGM